MLGEGDVPPDAPCAGSSTGAGGVVVDRTITGREPTKRKPEDVIKGPPKKGLPTRAQVEATMERYRRDHKDKLSKWVPSSFVKAFPLEPKNKLEQTPPPAKLEQPPPPAPGLIIPKHHQLFTPPLDLGGSEIPLPDPGFPLPDFQTPTRKEE